MKSVYVEHPAIFRRLRDLIQQYLLVVRFPIRRLNSTMCIVVTFVSSCVHLFSIDYMSHDPHRPRFMCYLSFFTFGMLMLITADNFAQLFLVENS